MRYGVVFPQNEIGDDPAVVRDFILESESLGYDYLLAYDHVVGANGITGPYAIDDQFHEVFTLFAYGAAITERLEFVTGILILPQRQAALVAKQTAQIDLLSGGRIRLGVAVGWNAVEMAALGEDFGTRGKRIDEQIEVLKLLWTQEEVTYEGQYHNLQRVGINPMPVQRPIPLWFGGGADAVFRRMARHGAGWMPNTMSLEQAQQDIERLKRFLDAEGRTLDDFGIDVRVNVAQGTPDDWQAFMDAWRELGATHFAALTLRAGYTRYEQHMEKIRQFAELVRQC